MKILLINIAIFILNIIYLPFKLLPIQNKITFISRQSNKKSEDIKLLEKEIKRADKNIKVVILCKKIEKGFLNKLKYIFHMFIQMYHLSTSKLIILDSYCIAASVLKKKKNTIIIQMWHALGSFKKFGYSILDKKEGSSRKLAEVMKMHFNYDYIFTSSEESKKYFAEAFNYQPKNIIVMPLPRVDLLLDKKIISKKKRKIIKTYHELSKKENILYAPTFRKNGEDSKPIYNLINKIDYSKYNLIIKLHPLSKLKIDDDRVIIDRKFSTIDMMYVSDVVITDYSAIVFEASLLNKPLMFYCYDYSSYYNSRNFYLDYKKMPGVIDENAEKIVSSIEKKDYNLDSVKDFSIKYINLNKEKATKKIVEFIFAKMK